MRSTVSSFSWRAAPPCCAAACAGRNGGQASSAEASKPHAPTHKNFERQAPLLCERAVISPSFTALIFECVILTSGLSASSSRRTSCPCGSLPSVAARRIRHDGFGFDLHQHFGVDQPAHFDHSCCGPRSEEHTS